MASVLNMVGIWQEREMANGNTSVTPESVPDANTLRNLYTEVRAADNREIQLSKSDFESMLDEKELPKALVDLGAKLGIKLSTNKRKHTITLSGSGATNEEFRLFRALATDLVYGGEAVAEDTFGLSPRERLQAIMDYEQKNMIAQNRNNQVMNYELQIAKRFLRDNYGVSDDGIMERLRKQAAEDFTSTERMEHISEVTDLFDKILSERHQEKLDELAARRDELNEAIEKKDKSKYVGQSETTDTNSILSTDIDTFGLSPHTYIPLKNKGFNTLADIVSLTRPVFQRRANLSSKALSEVVKLIDKLGLSFGMDTSESANDNWDTVRAAYEAELGEIQEKLGSYTRLKALQEIGPQAIFDEIKQKFADLAAISDENELIEGLRREFRIGRNYAKKNIAWYRDQLRKIVDNFVYLRDEACKELETSELIRISIKLDDVTDIKDDVKHQEENTDGEEENDVNGVENQYKENWMFEFDTVSNWSKMSAQVRHMLYRCPLGKRKTHFGTDFHMPVMQVINTLIQEMQGVFNSQDMEFVLADMEKDYPWVGYIRQQIAGNKRLKTQLFRSIRRYTQSLAILKRSRKSAEAGDMLKNKLSVLNSGMTTNSILTAAQKQLASGVSANKKLSIYNDRELDLDNVDRAIEILENYFEYNKYGNPESELFTLTPDEIPDYIKEHPDILEDLHQVLTAIGFFVSTNDIRIIAARERPKKERGKNNLGAILINAFGALQRIKENGYTTIHDLLEESSDLSADRRARSSYETIARALTLSDRSTVEASIRENGKVRYSFVLPSVLDDLIVGFQGKAFSREKSEKKGTRVNKTIREFIEDKFGNDPRYAVHTDDGIHYRNWILETLAHDTTGIANGALNYITLLTTDVSHGEVRRDKVEQKDLTQQDRLSIVWSMYDMSGDDVYDNTEGSWFPIPLASDSGRMGFIRFTSPGDEQEVIKEAIIKELERMTEDGSDAHLPETYRKNKTRFCTFPVLNNPELAGYSVDDIIKEFIRAQETDQKASLDSILDDLVDSVMNAMIEKFKEENRDFYNARLKETDEDTVNGFIISESLFQMAINEIVNGDPAYYTGYNTGSDNIQKRAKQFIVPLDHIDIFNEDFLEAYKAYHGIEPDAELEEDEITEHVLYLKDPEIPSPSYADLEALYKDAVNNGVIDQKTCDMFLEGVKSIKYTDGQSFRSFDSMVMMMYALGEMEKGDELDLALHRIAEGRQLPSDSMVVRTALKPFLSGLIPIEESDGTTRLMPVQHKLSEQILTAALVQASGSRLGKSNALIALAELMQEDGIDTVIFTSGVKVGQNGAVDFGDVDVESASKEEIIDKIREAMIRYEDETGMSLIHKIPYSFYGIVAQNPDAGMDNTTVPIGVQLQKLIAADLPDQIPIKVFENGKWITHYEKALYPVEGVGDLTRNEILSLYNRLMTEKILRAYREVTGTFADKKQLSEALQRSCRNSSRNSAYLERAFSLDEYGNFVIPLCDLATLNMSSEFLNSIVKNAVSRISAPGKQLVSMSAFGVAKDLKIEFEYDENGKPIRYKSVDCLLPAWSRHIVEKCTDENGILDFEKLEKESPRLCKAIGTRIPTQFKNFILPLKCVGFLPTILGDTIVTAIDIVPLQDSDFDNDKVMTMFPSFVAHYMIDNWEKVARKNYRAYQNEFYDYDKLRKDYYYIVAESKQNGVFEDVGNYDFTLDDFIAERLNDPDSEKKYRRPNAPEGKPVSFDEYKEIHHDEYLRPDGPKLEYVEYDPNKELEEQSDDAINNGIISVMYGMLTGRGVATMSLAAGSPERFDSIIKTLEDHIPPKTYPDSPSDISTRVGQETRNNDGKQMIAVFANAEAMQAMLQHTDVGLIPGIGVKINGRTLESLHDVNIEDSLDYISRQIGTSVGASADNSKKPRLSVMNINLRTAPVVSLMLQLGYTMEEVSFFLNIPSIRHYTDTGFIGDYNPDVDEHPGELPGTLDDMLAAISFGDNYGDMSEEMQDYCDQALSVFLYLEKVGERLRMLSSLARGDSGGTAPHGPIENNLVRFLNYELFEEMEREDPIFENWRDVVKYSYEQEVSTEEVDSAKSPLAQAYITYGVVGAFRELAKYYPGIGDPNFRRQIKEIIKKYYNGYATVANVKNVMFSLYNYIESSYDCMRKDDMTFEETRNYYLNYFPEEAAQLIAGYPEVANSLLFRKLKLWSTQENDDPFISLDYEGTMLPETRDEFTAVWQQLLYAKNEDGTANEELRELGVDLFRYCYFRNGFRFGNGTFAHLAPIEARLFWPGYAEMLDAMQQSMGVRNYQNFEQEFVRNNLYDSRFCQTVPQAAHKPDGWRGQDGNPAETLKIKYRSKMTEWEQKAFDWYFAGDSERDTPRTAFLITSKGKDGITYSYYMKVSDNDVTGESTYVLVTPLGWKDKAVEYSATENGLTMISAFDQDEVARGIRHKGKNKQNPNRNKNYSESRRQSADSGNSSEEPNNYDEFTDDEGLFRGFNPKVFFGKGYDALLEDMPGVANNKKFQAARKAFAQLVSGKKGASKKGEKAVKTKQQVAREKKGGNKVSKKYNIIESSSNTGSVMAEEARCAQELGAYTICITDADSSQLMSGIHSATPNDSRWIADFYKPGNERQIASMLYRKLGKKTVKSVTLNLTGSYMNTMGRFATQDDIDKYVLNIYKALKDRGIYVKKVVSTAQPGIPLASARAAIKLGYALDIHPTSDYKMYSEAGGKPVSNKDAFIANLGVSSESKKKDGLVYDKEEGPFIIAKNKWTRDIVAKDKRTLYVFTDNTDRTSGSNRIAATTTYAKKYAGRRLLGYPNTTSAVIRGLENAFPISTQKKYSPGNPSVGQWTDADLSEFRRIILNEINDIIEAFESGEYKRVVLPVGGIFEGPLSGISKERTPKLYRELTKQMEYLEKRIDEIFESMTNDEGEEDSESELKIDTSDLLGKDEIVPIDPINGRLYSNVYLIDEKLLSSKGINICNSSGDEVSVSKLFVVVPKDATFLSPETWKDAKVYTEEGQRVLEKIMFKKQSGKPQAELPRELIKGKDESIVLSKKKPYNVSGLTWLDDNNDPIC